MNKIFKGLCIASFVLGCTVAANADEKENKDGFMIRAFRDMEEIAKLQKQIDRANFQAVKLETKAFYEEQKRLSKPSVRTAAEKERMQKELEVANQRVAEAQEKVDSLKNNDMTQYKLKTGKVEEKVVNAYKKIEKGVVDGYQAIEDAVVGTYKKIEDKFVETFLKEVPEEKATEEEAKKEKPSEENKN